MGSNVLGSGSSDFALAGPTADYTETENAMVLNFAKTKINFFSCKQKGAGCFVQLTKTEF